MSRRRNSGRCFRCYFRPPLAARPSLPENGKCLFRGGECENGLDHLPTKKRARASVLLFRFSFVYRISHNRGSAFIFLKKKNIYLYSPRYFSASRIKIAKEHISDNRSNKERKLFVSIRNIRKLDISRFDVQPFPSIHPRSSIFDTHEASFQATRFSPAKREGGKKKKKRIPRRTFSLESRRRYIDRNEVPVRLHLFLERIILVLSLVEIHLSTLRNI